MKHLQTTFSLLAALFLGSFGATAATYEVNNSFDPGNGICDAAGCTLREAINTANANPGADTIEFNIPGAGLHTITPTSALPTITEAVTIDGYTQPGALENTLAVGNDAVLMIELNGASAGLATIGLDITGDDCVIRGLVINRFDTSGININSESNIIEGNFVGTDAAGMADLGNGYRGISITDGDQNLIGGPLPAARNLISGNGSSGVVIFCCGDNSNLIEGNYIGTDRNGTTAIPNDEDGVTISGDSYFNTVGGAEAGAGNLLSGNIGNGVLISSTNSSNSVYGNLIGTNASGTDAVPNGGNGVVVAGPINAEIGGIDPGTRNVISGNLLGGVLIDNPSTNVLVRGNYIGTDITGTVSLGNQLSGAAINNTSGNTIGGVTAAARNIIAGNFGGNGVALQDGASGNFVQGNYIGTDVTGNVALGVLTNGVLVNDAPSNTIGGSLAGAGNVLSGCGIGVQLFDTGTTGNSIQGNRIGTNAAGTGSIPNSTGILLFQDSAATTIGGTGSAGNLIAFNTATGVSVNPASSDNTIVGNSIFSNGALGIDLSGGAEDANQVTANDFPDADVGANNLQNYPLLNSITVAGAERTLEGELASNANTDYTLDFYSNSAVDPSGYGEGETYLGFLDVHTNALGRVEFSFPLDPSALGKFITATATDPNGNTSEFSMASEIVPSISRFQNISTRLRVQTGDNVLIGGFIITGNEPKKVIIRAVGPSLGGQGVAGPLADPLLELNLPDGTAVTNDNWRDDQEAEIIATGIPPAKDKESAIVATLDPGSYTAVVRGATGGSGVGLVEIYDLSGATDSDVANISTRGFVETGDNVMIGGIIVGPDDAADGSILLRAIGPSLAGQNVPNALADPMLELRDNNANLVASNNDWKSTQQDDIEDTGAPPTDDKESAILATLPAGSYTAIVSGVGGTTGVGLVEAYHLN